MDLLADVFAFLDELGHTFSHELAKRSLPEWLLFLAPLVLMELPHYYLPIG